MALALVAVVVATFLAACEIPPPTTIAVNRFTDGVDADPSDGICEHTPGAGDCTLRAAVDEANARPSSTNPRILLQPGTYSLTLVGADDANQSGDLDISSRSGMTTIEAPAPGAKIDATNSFDPRVIDVRKRFLELRGVALTGSYGSAVRVGPGAHLTLDGSVLHHNKGAGVRVDPGGVALSVNSTISDNFGPGVIDNGLFVSSYSTITRNTGGITGIGDVSAKGTIVGDQTSGADCTGPIQSYGNNLDSDGSCGLAGSGDISATAPELEPLSGNLLPAHRPLAASPAVDAVAGAGPGCGGLAPDIDQPRYARPAGPACDIGAVERRSGLALVVDSAADAPDATPGDGLCAAPAAGGACTMRAAVDETNTYIGEDTIAIAEGIDPTLALAGRGDDANLTGDLDVTDELIVEGNGSTLDAAGIDRAMDVPVAVDVAIHDLTVTGGNATGDTPRGGGIRAAGATSLEDVTLSGNEAAADGGGIDAASLEITGGTVSGNTAGGVGGGISAAALHATDVTVDGNHAAADGGGILADSKSTIVGSRVRGNDGSTGGGIAFAGPGTATVSDTIVSGNTTTGAAFDATAGMGGGIYASGALVLEGSTVDGNAAESASLSSGGGIAATGALTVTASTISRNAATSLGGGIYATGSGVMALTNSTVSSNSVGVLGHGGGIAAYGGPYSTSGPVFITASTLEGNTAPSLGPAIEANGPVTVAGSIIDSPGFDCYGTTPTSLGHNIGSDSTCGFTAATDSASVDPLLSPLTDNGGPTQTHLPALGSPAVDSIPAGTAGLCDGSLATDQRGVSRPDGAACDVGAVEGESGTAVEPLALTVDSSLDAPDASPGDGVCATAAGACTLRAAVDESNARATSDEVTIADGIDPTLSITGREEEGNRTGDLDVSSPLRIVGGGATIDGGHVDRVFDAGRGGALTLEDLTISGGEPGSQLPDGAAIDASDDLSLTDVIVTGNKAGGNAGWWPVIQAAFADVSLVRTSIVDNQGGGVEVGPGNLVVEASTIADNEGYAVDSGTFGEKGTLTMTNSTVSANRAGIVWEGIATITASTIADHGAGIAATYPVDGATITLRGVVLDNDRDCDIGTTVASGGFNRTADTSCGLADATDSTSPTLLGALADNGGPTPTRLPGSGSSAVDAIPVGTVGLCDGAVATDQRGTARPQGSACDVGAVEQ